MLTFPGSARGQTDSTREDLAQSECEKSINIAQSLLKGRTFFPIFPHFAPRPPLLYIFQLLFIHLRPAADPEQVLAGTFKLVSIHLLGNNLPLPKNGGKKNNLFTSMPSIHQRYQTVTSTKHILKSKYNLATTFTLTSKLKMDDVIVTIITMSCSI